ncbi:MAG: TlpA family protein disulfide reductase [candidate division NC10 bacterium]|nr:TlpA family protein disulfide reductase [candidate division NC10 bacterium]
MIGFLRRRWPGRPAVEAGTPDAAEPVEGLRRWRRHLTVDNAIFIVMVLVLAFILARRQGFFLSSPSVEVRIPTERGAVAPDFVLPTLAGPPIRLSDHQGKVVLLNFWATWCPPCRAEMPSMEKLYRAYRDRGLVILAVSGDRTGRSVVESFVQERGVTFPILLDSPGEVFAQYGVRGLPTSYLLDRQGRIVSADIGARDWSGKAARQVVERLMAEK